MLLRHMHRYMTVLCLLSFAFIVRSSVSADSLYDAFQNPPRQYTVRPFWFWAGEIDSAEVARQIREMCSQGVYGVFVHARGNLETKYLSEDWWTVIGHSLRVAREAGFHFSVVDEFEWPGGEARDIWNPGLPSKVLQKYPAYRMHHLVPQEYTLRGPVEFALDLPQKPYHISVYQVDDEKNIIEGSLADISESWRNGSLAWTAPAGEWTVEVFYLTPTQGVDGGLVDIMNPNAIREFMRLTHEEYYRRFGEYFGREIDMIYSDHEGDYGRELAWTPRLFDRFRELKGYELKEKLSLLTHEAGAKSVEVRYDFLDVITDLYAGAFFEQEAEWVRKHNTRITGHLWESPLWRVAAFTGDHFRLFRAWDTPGIDALLDWGRSPRDFKEIASVSHYKRMLFTCENQGLHGWDTWFDLQKARLGTNGCGAWGVSMFIPHAFNYMKEQIIYPPDWFFHQPFWKYFHHYADYARRISFMNATGIHSAPLLVYSPMTSAFAAMGNLALSHDHPDKWDPAMNELEENYRSLQEALSHAQWDYDIVDDSYLAEADFSGGKIRIADETYGALILPPMKYIRKAAAERILAFVREGGTVIAWNELPGSSPIIAESEDVAGLIAKAFSRVASTSPGKGVTIKGDIRELIQYLDESLENDVRIEKGKRENLFVYHTKNEGKEIYWLVNDTDEERINLASFSVAGSAEKWDVESGDREAVYYYREGGRTFIPLRFGPWDAYYIVIDPEVMNEMPILKTTSLNSVSIVSSDEKSIMAKGMLSPGETRAAAEFDYRGKRYTGIRDAARPIRAISLPADGWRFSAESPVPAVYARTAHDPGDNGGERGFHLKDFNDGFWEDEWLSPERLTVREWMIIGPFPNEAHEGFIDAYPPENEIDFSKVYEGRNGEIRWQKHTADEYYVDLGEALTVEPREWCVSYACTYVHSDEEKDAVMRLAMDNNARVWINGEDVLSVDVHPFYYRMRDAFALERKVHLKKGWNEVLLKIGLGRHSASGVYGFMFKFVDDEGTVLSGLATSPEKKRSSGAESENERGSVWYRIQVPPGICGMEIPNTEGPADVYFNGNIVTMTDGIYRFPEYEGTENTVAIRLPAGHIIRDYVRFVPGESTFSLGAWTKTGLSYYVGSARYERTWEMPAACEGRRIYLDLGEVGSAAEVFVNGVKAGERVWKPFRFDITNHLKPGKNEISILVTNTDAANEAMGREVGSWTRGYVLSGPRRLEFISVNGLMGPVCILPETEVTLECKP